MATKDTVQIGNPILRSKAKPVNDFNDKALPELIADLKDTLRAENLVGMAAPQIGHSLRVFVSEIREDNWRQLAPSPFTVYINPEICSISRETALDYEGCGSVAEGQLFGKVGRAKEITLKYIDETGVSHETELTDLLARIAHHEIDHLNGVLFTDLADPKTLVSREWLIEHVRGK